MIMHRYGVKIIDQKGGPSGWKFIDGSSNKLAAGANIPLSTEQQQALSEKNRSDKKRKYEEKDALREAEVRKVNEADKKQKVKALLEKEEKKVSPAVQGNTKAASASAAAAAGTGATKTVEGVIIQTVRSSPAGTVATKGKRIKMHYIGKLQKNGKVFDSSDKPFTFRLGAGEVIRGWDIGIHGMRVGEKRMLTIPPEKGYGRAGAGPKIPPNATLIFDVTCIDVSH